MSVERGTWSDGDVQVGSGLVFTDGPSSFKVDVPVRRIVVHQPHGFSVVVSYDLMPSTGFTQRASVVPA